MQFCYDLLAFIIASKMQREEKRNNKKDTNIEKK